MTFVVQTNIKTDEIGIDSKDRLYETLQLHGDSSKFKKSRILILSEGANPEDNLVSDIQIDYVNQKQEINTFATSGTVESAENLYTRLSRSVDDTLSPVLGLKGDSSYERVP